MASNLPNDVRAVRRDRGLTVVELAARSGLSRQSIGAIEAGRAVPAIDVALRIARALETPVERLFGVAEDSASIDVEPVSPTMGGRVALGFVDGRWVAHPLSGDRARLSADGFLLHATRSHARVDPVGPLDEARDNVLVMGCAAGLGLLAERLNRRRAAGRFVWFTASSTAALRALARGHVHVAGVHLVDGKTGEANLPDVRRIGPREPVVLVTLGRWEAGLVTRTEDRDRIRGIGDLGRRGVRLAVREIGAGARRLLERELEAAGRSTSIARAAALEAHDHFEVARLVALGAADAGIATRDAAIAHRLRFTVLAEERYDLALTRASLGHPPIERLLDALTSHGFRRDLSALGYDVRATGERVAEIRAA